MKEKWYRLSALLLAVILAAALLAGCSGGGTVGEEGAGNGGSDEPVTLKVFFNGSISGVGTPSGIQTDDVATYIQEKTGVLLDFIPDTANENLLPLLASGDLPDLTFFNDKKHVNSIIQGNLAVEITDEMMDRYGADILANAPEKIEFSKVEMSNGTGSLYCIPGLSGPAIKDNYYTFGFVTRWDLYGQLGYPAISSTDDMIAVLQRMLELEPENREGQKNYGFSFNTDWDGMCPLYAIMIGPIYGYDTTEHEFHAEINTADAHAAESILRDDSMLFKGARFLYDLNQAGLLDPESISQKWDSVQAKYDTGRVMFSYVMWPVSNFNNANAPDGKSMLPLFPEDSTSMWDWSPDLYGSIGQWVISSNCAHPEKALNVLNAFNSIDVATAIFSLFEGQQWEIVDGDPRYFDDVAEKVRFDEDYKATTGFMKYWNASGLEKSTILPGTDGLPIDYRMWPYEFKRDASQVVVNYLDHYNVTMPYEVYDNFHRGTQTYSDPYRPLMGVMPDDIAMINQKISDMLNTEVYKMIFAANDEEFESARQSVVSKAYDLGYDSELEWILDERSLAKERYHTAS